MSPTLRIISAGKVTLEVLAESFNAAFAGYFFPITLTAEQLAKRVRLEQLDLSHSLLAYDDEQLVGMALLGLRGERAWVGGFGITTQYRGRGLAHLLMKAALEEARLCRARQLSLEVLTQNDGGRRTYERAGMAIERDLIILSRAGDQASPSAVETLRESAPAEMLQHFTRLHNNRPAWQRELPALMLMSGLRALYLGEPEHPLAYALLWNGPPTSSGNPGPTYLVDLAADSSEHAHQLCMGLSKIAGELRIINEPEQSIFIAALKSQGFQETARQHEMLMRLL